VAQQYWLMKSELEKEFPRPLPLADLRNIPALKDMILLRKGNRLSVMPVTAKEFHTTVKMAGKKIETPLSATSLFTLFDLFY